MVVRDYLKYFTVFLTPPNLCSTFVQKSKNDSLKKSLYQINDIKFISSYDNMLITCGGNSKIKIWDIEKKTMLKEISTEGKYFRNNL